LAPLVIPEIDAASESLHAQNYKSLLQHIAQKTMGATPIYRLLDERGPDHSKCFHISAVIASRAFPSAWGSNKKEAEQLAAQNALQELQGQDVVDNSLEADSTRKDVPIEATPTELESDRILSTAEISSFGEGTPPLDDLDSDELT
jgi:hypothetical protein